MKLDNLANKQTDTIYAYAGFWIRLRATIVDSFLMLLVTMPVLYMIYGNSYFLHKQLVAGLWDFIIYYVIPSIAVIVFWAHK